MTATLALPLVFSGKLYASTGLDGHKIVLDAGHGGDDPGSDACTGLYEKDANYDIAVSLKEKLEDGGAIVYLTRDQDNNEVDDLVDGGTYSNEDRYDFANSTKAEVLISIHLNGSSNPLVNGSMNLYSKPKKDKEFTSVIHTDMAKDLGDIPDLGITNFMSGVTLRFNGPAVLTEPVFISNTNECLTLKANNRQNDIANVLYNGLLKWFSGDYELLVIGKAGLVR